MTNFIHRQTLTLLSVLRSHVQSLIRSYETIVSFMLHEPCCTANFNASCMVNDKCNKRFSKAFSDQTLSEIDEYSIYRRRDNDIRVYKHDHIFTNAHVALYNFYLSTKYNCHINVEIAT